MRLPRSAANVGVRHEVVGFLFGFACVFAGLALPARGLGPLYVRAHVALVEPLLAQQDLASGVKLLLVATHEQLLDAPWQALLVASAPSGVPAVVPIDFRLLLFLPTAAFVALGVATPFGSWRKNARLLGLGLPLLELVLVGLVATPLVSFLGGTGPLRAFELGRAAHACLQIVYRALVAPPGMAFALPLLLWWLLVTRLGGARWVSQNRSARFGIGAWVGCRISIGLRATRHPPTRLSVPASSPVCHKGGKAPSPNGSSLAI